MATPLPTYTPPPLVLLVGSELATVQSVSAMLASHSCETETLATGSQAIARLYRNPAPDIVLLELAEDNRDGLETLRELRQIRPNLNVVVLSTIGDHHHIDEAIRTGAQDCLRVPVCDRDLLDLLRRHLHRNWEAELSGEQVTEEVGGGHCFLAASPLMQKVRVQAELLANIDVPVLILGESGTGKEVTAHLIHKLSARRRQRFLKINCAALPGELLESELFGYERGAFTGAMKAKAGKFELCDKGTILLDEVAEMPANLQAKLLHVLQDKQFSRLGSETTLEVDVRILAATNVDIQQAMAEHRFREDLYYRLSAFTIGMPPLRERKEEIPILLKHFMERTASQYARPPLEFSSRLLDACQAYPWPGNLRELQNFVKRYLVMADEIMALGELQANSRRRPAVVDEPLTPGSGLTKPDTLVIENSKKSAHDLKCLVRNLKDETEIRAITKALAETNWNRKRAARLLQISYRGLLYKIRQHGIIRVSASQVTPAFGNRASDA